MKELELAFPKVDSLRDLWSQAYQRLTAMNRDGQGFATSVPLPGISITAEEVRARLLLALDGISALRQAPSELLATPQMASELTATLDQLNEVVLSLSTNVSNVESNGGIGSITSDGFTITSANGGTSANFGKIIRNASGILDALLPSYQRIVLAILSANIGKPTGVSFEAVRVLADADKLATEIKRTQSEILARQREIDELRTAAETAKLEAERLKTESEQSRKSIGEYEAEVTQKLASVRAVSAEAERLQQSVSAYQPEYDDFQKALTQRNEFFASATEQEKALIARLVDKEAEIGRINDSANAMLTGATVAGLASSFGEIRDKVTAELNSARNGFYFAVGVLFLSVLPLAVYVIPGLSLFGLIRGSSSAGDFELGQVLIRALLLVPSAWLTKFAAARHATLFRLREHYTYKYSIASSVEGFKKQAPSLQDEIAATAFKELTFNPADRMEAKSPEASHPNPLIDWIMRKVGATHDGKSE